MQIQTKVEETYDCGLPAEFPDTVILHQGSVLSPLPVFSSGRYVM